MSIAQFSIRCNACLICMLCEWEFRLRWFCVNFIMLQAISKKPQWDFTNSIMWILIEISYSTSNHFAELQFHDICFCFNTFQQNDLNWVIRFLSWTNLPNSTKWLGIFSNIDLNYDIYDSITDAVLFRVKMVIVFMINIVFVSLLSLK